MLAHELAKELLAMPNLPVAVSANSHGFGITILSVHEEKDFVANCECRDCKSVKNVVCIHAD